MSKNKIVFVFLITITIAVSLVYFLYYAGILGGEVARQEILDQNIVDGKNNLSEVVDYTIEEVASGLYVPWSIVFTSKDRILVAERNGYIKEIVENQLNNNEIYYFDDLATNAEEGLMGMDIHPEYSKNKYIYACYAYYKDNQQIADRIVRLIDSGDKLNFDRIILDDIPAARFHAGCRVKFGPDKKLYVTTGDAIDKEIAQDFNSLGGKILRINDDGSVPQDNPIENSYIYSLGHRNPQGIDWDSQGNLYSSEHGPSGFDGPGGGDELNLIKPGNNYGWPLVSHEKSQSGLVDPLVVWTPAIAPGSLTVYKSDLFPQFKGDIFIGGLRGEGLYRVVLDNFVVGKWERMVEGYGRIREVAVSQNGEIYFSTSNNDSRGELNEGDDKIFRLKPVN